jgi:hypothetical protein
MFYAFITVILTVLVTLVVRKFIEMSEDFEDYRQIAFETPLEQQPFWVEKWNRWVILRELTGKERADLLDKSTEMIGKKAKVNIEKLYPMMVILSVRYPDPSCLPEADHPHFHEYPGANGKPKHPKAGQLIFTMRDIGLLNQKSGGLQELLNKPVAKMSGLREEDIEEKKPTFEEDVVESESYTIE